MGKKAALPFILAIIALPVLMLVVRPRHKGIRNSPRVNNSPRGSSSKARISYEPLTLENEETWEVVTDPNTGIPLKVIGHRKVRYG